jgi:hypothetical protein
MTALAVVSRRRVINGLARGGSIVMTANALAIGLAMVHALQWNKTTRSVTKIAALGGCDMPGRLRCCGDNSTLRMAILAIAQRPGEIAAAVTIAATSSDMCSVEAKAGRVMIKV